MLISRTACVKEELKVHTVISSYQNLSTMLVYY